MRSANKFLTKPIVRPAKIKELNPKTTIETLIPDFDGKIELIQKVIDAKPEVISHNLETVKRITPIVRSKAKYDLSLQVLKSPHV